jgi:hypothetical protein
MSSCQMCESRRHLNRFVSLLQLKLLLNCLVRNRFLIPGDKRGLPAYAIHDVDLWLMNVSGFCLHSHTNLGYGQTKGLLD